MFRSKKENARLAVVVSAFGGVTDDLIKMSQEAADGNIAYKDALQKLERRHLEVVKRLIEGQNRKMVMAYVKLLINELENVLHGVFLVKELSVKTLDFIMSFGERLSVSIISECLKAKNIDAEFLDARKLVKTDENFGAAKIDIDGTYQNIKNYFESHYALQIITGFIGSTSKEQTTTLGRGGSDYTASLFGAALNATELEIWTDVDGIMTADPRKVQKAFPIENMTYEEAMEISHFGAKVIHPPSMQPASNQKIPIRIRNTFNPEFKGTVISEKSNTRFLVKGISSIDDIALLRVQGSGMIGVVGISNRLFGALARKNINVVLISQASSEHTICFAVEPNVANSAKKVIEEEFSLEILAHQVDKVIIEQNLSIVAVVGENMRRTPGIAGKMFQALGKNGVNVVAIAQGSSELNISAVIDKQDESKALNALHETFFLSDTQSLNLFVLGPGRIGSTLLGQIQAQSEFLSKEYALEVHIIALGNTQKMVFDENGISLHNWKDKLEQSTEKIVLNQFVARMKNMNLPNSVFVDCTDSDTIINHYQDILSSSISIVTPNKKANSGSYETYRRLKESALRHGVKFFYETNVGAGLPIISTLNDLLCSGDKMLKIEAVLSGTLNFIFTSFNAEKKFSDVVREAKARGFSEPDPRDDLNGLDVARKILILAREIGLPLELKDISIEQILPESCLSAKTVDVFLEQLKTVDNDFELRRREAEKNGKALRYMAVLENGKALISLQEVNNRHPFYSLSGSDNMIVFSTERYKDRPLVVSGPGAGAEVTAAGVFADIIRIFYH